MRTRGRDRRDTLGMALALGLGVALGLAVSFPALPADLSVSLGGAEVGPVGTVLLVGVTGVFLVPVGVVTLYQLFILLE